MRGHHVVTSNWIIMVDVYQNYGIDGGQTHDLHNPYQILHYHHTTTLVLNIMGVNLYLSLIKVSFGWE
jgi:hypothetical protein